mgnify:FL=1
MINEDKVIIELINKSIAKDEKAFKSLIYLIQPEMYKIAKIKLKKEEYIYDVIQETIILIYKHLKKLKNKEFFRTWSMRILINECNKLYRKIEKKRKKFINYAEKEEMQYECFESIEAEINMNKLLDCLNDYEKIVVTLYYKDNYTTKEISDILNEPEGTIKSRIHRAKEKMKKYIKEENLYEGKF